MEQSKRKEQIADAAIGLIAKLGYAQASVGRIADAAGVSKGVFTYHFASKDELMEHIVRGVHEKAARFMRRIGTESTPGRMLGAYIETNCAFIAAHREEIAALSDIVTSARTPEGALRYGEPSGDPMLEPLVDILRRGEAAGEFKRFTPRSVRATAAALRSAIDGAARRLAAEPDFDIAGYAEDLADLFLSAVRKPGNGGSR